MATYDRAFYATVNDAGAASAQIVLPLTLARLPVSSAIDVGCGTGIWAAELLRLSVENVVGIDGSYVPVDQRRLDTEHFRECDISRPIKMSEKFDLALCLEVAEHLHADRSAVLIENLVGLAPAILFSAAAPAQGGTDHVNEQWPEYWIELFERHGYSCWDAIRPAIRYDKRVAWIYRQNIMLALAPDHPALHSFRSYAQLRLSDDDDTSFEYVARYILEREPSAADSVRRLATLLRDKARRR